MQNLLGPVATACGTLERGILGLIAVASLFLRLRRAREGEREQIKWLTYAASVVVIGAILTYVVPKATGAGWIGHVGLALLAVGFVGVPIAIGIAILKYRLYDINLLINHTLVYGSLTVTLLGIYVITVAVLPLGTPREALSQLARAHEKVVEPAPASASFRFPSRWILRASREEGVYAGDAGSFRPFPAARGRITVLEACMARSCSLPSCPLDSPAAALSRAG